MKAIRIYEFGEHEVMKIVEIERPVPEANEILVKMYAASVNPADYIIRRGGNESRDCIKLWAVFFCRPKALHIGKL